MFKNLIFGIFGLVILFGFLSCGNSKMEYENVKKESFRVEKLGDGTVKISWDSVKGAVYYEVKYKEFQLYQGEIVSKTVESPNIILTELTEDVRWIFAVKASTSKEWVSFIFAINYNNEGLLIYDNENIIVIDRPTLTEIPTSTTEDSIEIEVNGQVGTKVFLNNIDTGSIINSNGKAKIILDTSSIGFLDFYIQLEDDNGNKSNVLEFIVIRYV